MDIIDGLRRHDCRSYRDSWLCVVVVVVVVAVKIFVPERKTQDALTENWVVGNVDR